MEEMRRIAYETVLRACGFASLAIFCVMIGLSFLPRSRLPGGRFSQHVMTLVLVLKAHEARTKDHRRTEMWLYLPKESRPPQAHAQQTISTLMREIYLQFARWTSIISIVMWTHRAVLLRHRTLVQTPGSASGLVRCRYPSRAHPGHSERSYDLRLVARRQALLRAPKNCAIDEPAKPSVEPVPAESTIGTFQSNM